MYVISIVIYVAILVIIITNGLKDDNKDCFAINVNGQNIDVSTLVLIAVFWPFALFYFMLWLVYKAIKSLLEAIGIIKNCS